MCIKVSLKLSLTCRHVLGLDIKKARQTKMKFIYANELKKKYQVYGYFYNLKINQSVFKCRSILEIRTRINNCEIPDVVVIMMNPGASRPLNSDIELETFTAQEYINQKRKELVLTQPDPTQYQIMRLMELNNWNFVKVINLSDLRNGDSGKFQEEFNKAHNLDSSNPHCITNVRRQNELNEHFKSKCKIIIAAWGSIPELQDSAETILDSNINIIGLQVGDSVNFRHPSPRLKEQKLDWLEKIQEEIITNASNGS